MTFGGKVCQDFSNWPAIFRHGYFWLLLMSTSPSAMNRLRWEINPKMVGVLGLGQPLHH